MLLIKDIFSKGLIILAIFSLGLTGCGASNETSNETGGTGTLNLRITDSPFLIDLIEEATVTISKISIHVSDSPEVTSGFITLTLDQPKTFDLLKLQGGVTDSLISASIPAGTYKQIRLFVDSASVKLDGGVVFPLEIPSGSQSGIKIFPKPSIIVDGGLTTDLVLDFDVSRSFTPIPASSTKASDISEFKFHPVVRVVNSSSAGSISGTILSDNGTQGDASDDMQFEGAAITAFEGTVEVSTAFSQTNGSYVLPFLPEGTYNVTASHTSHDSSTETGIIVVVGNNTGGVDFTLPKQ